jgi:hypothetical protein
LSLFVAAYAPVGTPLAIIGRLQARSPCARRHAVADKLIAQARRRSASTPEELAKVLARETPIWAELIRQSGAKVE